MNASEPMTRAAAWRAGVLYTATISPSYLVFGTVCGVSSKQAGADVWQALLLPALVFGGSSQIVLTALIIAGAPVLVVIASAVMVNARMAIYSGLMRSWLQQATTVVRLKAATLIVDQTFVAAQSYKSEHPNSPFWLDYYFSAGVSLWIWWLACNMLGFFVGAVVPSSWELEFAVPLSFVAVLAPLVKRAPMALAATLGAGLSVVFFSMPLKLGLIAACFIAVAILLVLDQKFKWTPTPPSGSQS